jgi:hypothetical protein
LGSRLLLGMYDLHQQKEASVRLARELNHSTIENLEGDWKVERLSGVVPMPGVWKRVRGPRGSTRIGRSPGVPFRLEQREGYVALIYRWPLHTMVDELRYEGPHSWLGRATAAGCEYGRFRMARIERELDK